MSDHPQTSSPAVIYVRPVEPHDVGAAVALIRAFYEDLGVPVTAEWHRLAERAMAADERTHILVAEDRLTGDVVGVVGGFVDDRFPHPLRPLGRFGHVQWMAVAHASRGRGIGTHLLRSLLDWFDSVEVEAIDLFATDQAVRLYARAGFQTKPLTGMRLYRQA